MADFYTAPPAQSIPELIPCSTDNAHDRALVIADTLIPILVAGLEQHLHGDMSAARAARAQFIAQLRDEIADIKREAITETALDSRDRYDDWVDENIRDDRQCELSEWVNEIPLGD